MENATEKQILLTCFHCGNKGLQNIVGEHEERFGGPVFDSLGNQVGLDLEEIFTYYLLACPACRNVTLYQRDTDDSMCGAYNDKTLYPKNSIDLNGVPQNIKNAFESAVRVESVSEEICLLALRRTLEMICKERNAQGIGLVNLIKDLISKGILPDALNDACWIIRVLGNEAAHGEKSSVSKYEVEEVIGFVETIIDYIYSLPSRIYQLKRTINARHEKARTSATISENGTNLEE